MKRDFAYIDDIVEGIVRLIDKIPNDNPDWSGEKLNLVQVMHHSRYIA